MAPKRIAVAFDLDDTLYPESAFVHSGFEAVADYLAERSAYASEELFERLEADFRAGIRGDSFDRLLDETGIEVDVGTLVGIYRTHEPQIGLADDARACLGALEGRTIGLITDGTVQKQQNKLRALGLHQRVDIVCISDEIGDNARKPSTVAFERFLQQAGITPRQAVYVADNPARDFVAPNELGMYSIWVDRPWGEYADNEPTGEKQEPTRTVTTLRDVPAMVQQWETE